MDRIIEVDCGLGKGGVKVERWEGGDSVWTVVLSTHVPWTLSLLLSPQLPTVRCCA